MKHKLTSILFAFMLVFSTLPVHVQAVEAGFVVTGGTENVDYTYTDGVLSITSGKMTVKNQNPLVPTSDRIEIQGTASITLAGVNIDTDLGAPIEVDDHSGTNVTIILENENTLVSRMNNKAGLHKSRGQSGGNDCSTLTITGNGSLKATGGDNASGIGAGGYHGDVANLTIESGHIIAQGQGDAAGIGASFSGSVWQLNIQGGNIQANGNPGIGAGRWSGVQDANITGGFIFANSYKRNSPTGGISTFDSGKTYGIYGKQTIKEDLSFPKNSIVTIAKNSEITIAPENTLTINGKLANYGTIVGQLNNQGTIYNNQTLPATTGGTIHHKPYLEVENGSYSGNQTITLQADEPPKGMMFDKWTVEIGNVTLDDAFQATTTFEMPDECVVIKANYKKYQASITTTDGNVQYFDDVQFAIDMWSEPDSTLTLFDHSRVSWIMHVPDNGILDLGGYTLECMDFPRNYQTFTIQNGELKIMPHGFDVSSISTLRLKNITLSPSNTNSQINNDGQIIDLGGLVIDPSITINGNSIKSITSYIDQNGKEQIATIDALITSQTTSLTDGWYLVQGELTIDKRITISGDVKFILADDAKLTVNGGINVENDNHFTIYAQAKGNGELYALGNKLGYSGIGGQNGQSAGTIIINGGIITAKGGLACAGIGGSNPGGWATGGSGGNVIINAGVVYATGGSQGSGIGGGMGAISQGNFTTSTNGNLVVFASSIGDQSQKTQWSGIIFENNMGQVYGNNLILSQNFEIPSGYTLTLKDNQTLTNNGNIKVNIGASYTGTQPSGNPITYQISWDIDGDGIVDETNYEPYAQTISHQDGAKPSTEKYDYVFTSWDTDIQPVTRAMLYTAQFKEIIRMFDVILSTGEGYTLQYNGNTHVAYGTDFTFTIEIAEGYSKTDNFAIKANNQVLSANSDGSYTINITQTTTITVEGIQDITGPSAQLIINNDTFDNFNDAITFNTFTNDKYEISISSEDIGSGLQNTQYYLTNTPLSLDEVQTIDQWIDYQEPFTICDDGHYVVYAKLTDHAGNITYLSSNGLVLDHVTPTAVQLNTNGYSSGQWTNQSVQLTLSGSTALSGIERYEYSTDNGQTWSIVPNDTLMLSTPTNGTTYIFRAVSKAGNYSENSEAILIKIDKQAPTIFVTGDTKKIKPSDTIEIQASAGISGYTIEVSKDDSAFQTIDQNTYTITENGTYTFKITNGVGITAFSKITYTNIDGQKPILSLDSHGYQDGTWSNQNIKLSLENTVSNLGKTTFEYKVDQGQWQSFDGELTILEDTKQTIYTFRAKAENGLTSDEISFTIKKDTTPPDAEITIKNNSIKTLINKVTFELFFHKNVDINIQANDKISGVQSILYYRSEEILNQEQVQAITDWQTYTSISETAKDANQFVYYVKVIDNAGNIAYFASNGIVFDTVAPVITGINDGETYYTTQKVIIEEANLDKVTLNGQELNGPSLRLPGNIDQTYIIEATDKAGQKSTVTVIMKPIANLDDALEGKTPENVTSDDKDDLEAYISDLEDKLNNENTSDQEKDLIKELINQAQDLIDKIEEISNAVQTDSIDKITIDNLQPSDKEMLLSAKDDIESALHHYHDNLTDQEKAYLQQQLDKINELLNILHKIEELENCIASLPDTVQPDDLETEKQIQNVKEAYDALSDYEKTILSKQSIDKLNRLLLDLVDYRIIQGNNFIWTIGSNEDWTIIVNGPLYKFASIQIDGTILNRSNYTVTSGSTILSLKANYLNTLQNGKHALTILYTDGQVSLTFEVKKSDTNTPETGDTLQLTNWILLGLSAAYVCAYLYRKKASQ